MPKYQTTPEANQLLLEGSIALAEIEGNGVRVDKTYLDTTINRIETQIGELESDLRTDPVWRTWQRRFGVSAQLGNPNQLAAVVFRDLGFESRGRTASGKRDKADEASFEGVDLPFLKPYFRVEKLRKALSTYLYGIRREMVETAEGWFVHPIYNLNTVTTFRSSSDHPNFQNIPVRNAEMAEIIRRCYIPRFGNHFVEVDFAQIEVRVAAAYNLDPVLIDYVNDPTKDMHRDMAMEIYCIKDPKNVTKETRHAAKNQFVFPEFYGSKFFMCATHLWEAMDRRSLTLGKDGIPLKEHLSKRGITELGDCDMDDIDKNGTKKGTFVHHLKEIEKDFWGKRFSRYAEWKREWFEEYKRAGGFRMHTGFAVNAALGWTDVTNWAIQGSAFHCELWSLIELTKALRKYKMKAKVVGEIHDSDQGDVPPNELQDYLEINHEIKTRRLPKAWPWINVPLEVEMEVCPVDEPWFTKKQWIKNDEQWVLKT